jgi:hypothetical protein
LQNHGAAFRDRDLLTLDSFEDGPTGEVARREFGIGRGDFAVVLVGKDGGEKLRSTEPLRSRDLLDRIDAMPMRRREMRENDAG